MYKVASDKRQTTLHRGRPSDWVNGSENQTEMDRWRSLKAGIQNLDARIQQMPRGPERRALGLQKLEWQNELAALRPRVKANNIDNTTFQDCFMEVAREQLLPAQFQAMLKAAERAHDQRRVRAALLRESSPIENEEIK